MSYRLINGRTNEELLRQLNGYVIGTKYLDRTSNATDGLTLIFTAPAATTITFVGDLSPSDIVAAINAGAGLTGVARLVHTAEGRTYLALAHDVAVTLSDTGTSNPLFGFSTTASDPDLTGEPVDPTKVVGFGQNVSGGWAVLIAP